MILHCFRILDVKDPSPPRVYPPSLILTLLLVQQEVAVLVAAGDGVRDAVPVRVVGVNDGDQRVRTGVLAQEGPVTVGE